MPIIATRGAGSAKGFGFTGGGAVFICATGGTVVDCGDFRTHIFTGPGSFVVSKAPSAPTGVVDYFVVAGGGGSGRQRAGGGGAGGFRLSNSLGLPAPTTSPLANPAGISVTAQTYPITVGAGGAGGPSPSPAGGQGLSGNPSVFSTITSTGGGGGGSTPTFTGGNGGSGGGGGCGVTNSVKGTGNSPPVSPPQGNPGGYGRIEGTCQPFPGPGSGPFSGGGGGGAGARGNNACGAENFRQGGQGGDGSYIAPGFVGPTAPSYGTPGPVSSTRYFAGGGGGNSCSFLNPGGLVPGGAGGGGNAINSDSATAGTVNTGGGGGAIGTDQDGNGKAGGSGIVMIRYKYK
jgi:hypothetical protein